MSELNILQQVVEQYGLLGLIVGFLILGPGFTYFRTRHIRTEVEVKAQTLLNEFAQQERQRSAKLEARFDATLQQLNLAEEEVSNLRVRLANAQNGLDELPKLRQRIRQLMKRVAELETASSVKQVEINGLQQEVQRRQSDSEQNTQRIRELEQLLKQEASSDAVSGVLSLPQ